MWLRLQAFHLRQALQITARRGQHCRHHHVKTIGMQIKIPGGDFALMRASKSTFPELLWLIFVELEIDFGSTFSKYLPPDVKWVPG